MKKNGLKILCLLLGLAVIPYARAELTIQEGNWKISQVIDTRTCHRNDGRVSETTFELSFEGSRMKGYVHIIIDDPNTGVSDLTEYMTGEFEGPCSTVN